MQSWPLQRPEASRDARASGLAPTLELGSQGESLKLRIRQLGEDLDAHRKSRQALHPALTMAGMYNVLDKLRQGEALTAKDKAIHEQGLVSVLRQLHDELDAAVLAAYGWDGHTPALLGGSAALGATSPGDVGGDAQRLPQGPVAAGAPLPQVLLPQVSLSRPEVEEIILHRLVALNAERAAEERRGLVRWLRPDFQSPGGTGTVRGEVDVGTAAVVAAGPKPDWPKALPDQFQALRAALAARSGPAGALELAQGFARAPRAKVAELLETLASLGHARRLDDGRYLSG